EAAPRGRDRARREVRPAGVPCSGARCRRGDAAGARRARARVDRTVSERTLVRGLGPWASASIVVGTVIGTGVFLKTAVMAYRGGSPGWVLAAWGVAAVLSFTGAMTYSELGGMFPAAGGEYVYLRHGYSPFMGYLFAWNRFWIATPGSIAAYAVGSATFLSAAPPLDAFAGQLGPVTLSAFQVVGVVLIAVFTAVNCLNVRSGGNLQTVLTALKLVMIAGIIAGALFTPRGSWSNLAEGGGFPGWG